MFHRSKQLEAQLIAHRAAVTRVTASAPTHPPAELSAETRTRCATPAGTNPNHFYAVGAEDRSNERTTDPALGVDLLPASALSVKIW
jgi:hypothetical protein